MREIKANSSRWLNESGKLDSRFAWRDGYGAFAVSKTHLDAVYKYIENQEVHHQKILFREEYITLLKKNDIAFDEQKAIDGWYGMITYFLLMDDLADIREDLISGEENAIVDAGLNQEGIDKIESMMNDGIDKLNLINPILANRIEHKKSLIDIPQLLESIRRSL
jgi:hypothetical protein